MVFPPATPPAQSNDFFDIAGLFGLSAPTGPQVSSGINSQQNNLPNNRAAISTRHQIRWLVPEGPIVEMYINPQNISYNYKKTISPQRTKGGYVIQYWGEDLVPLNISGTTGTSGIEGINVLYNVYRAEQLAFDPFALYQAAQKSLQNSSAGVFGTNSALGSGNVLDSILNASQSVLPKPVANPPSLAALACTVEMYWSGEVYRGYFTDFSVKESASELGLFNYDINFMVTQRRGFRQNFLAWHRSPTDGPSNSDPINGIPYSFGSLVTSEPNGYTPGTVPSSDTLNSFATSLGLGGF